ncbi:hypothetical protein K435DRAFT_898290 [Dendrothele bispora CBS 962.96]|uniref:NADH:flavin oxidoreductase/NADH oxidase N-terminal domain-containing protein n=1 Tax=Dendrothele bispora (strain CBS 962.96) TaxID=1314807 RepID=A0A4S8LZC6_DENBC|nr:hypothetical protein K435DRAFT_898290 [Dendrothele bispora CBS 962.96]
MVFRFNGYLVDHFPQDVSNKRTDEYGGSVENRSRFAMEVVKIVSDAIGEERTALRISPWSPWQGMWDHIGIVLTQQKKTEIIFC